jgi:hypothetical protein
MWLKAVLVVAVLVTTVVIAVRQVPLGVPGEWTWSRQALAADITEAMDRLLIPLIVSAALVVFCRFIDRQIAHASTRRQVVFVGLLVVAAMCWMDAVRQAAASPHREVRPLWVLYDKYASGYFFEAVFEIKSQHDLLTTYEARMAEGDVLHEGTHPPGLFLLNWWAVQATQKFPQLISVAKWTQRRDVVHTFRQVEAESRLARPLTDSEFAALCMVSFISVLLAAMTVIPVYGIVRMFCNRRTAWRAACLMMTIPCIAVFAPRSDIVYAFTGTLMLWFMLESILAESDSVRAAFGVAAGLVTFISLATSLAHLPVLVVVSVFSCLLLRCPQQVTRSRVFVAGAIVLAVLCVAVGAWTFATDCNLLNVWKMNLANHAGFYSQSPRTWWKWLLVNPIEIGFALGLPLTSISMICVSQTWRTSGTSDEPPKGQTSIFGLLIQSMMLTWLLLWLSGKNSGEAARLWCFVTPWFVITTAYGWPLNGQPWRRNPSSSEMRSQHSTGWLLLLIAQLVVGTITVGCVSGYSLLDVSL